MTYIKYFKATVLCKTRYVDTYKSNVSYQLVWYNESKLSLNVAQCSCVLQVNCYSSVTVSLPICNNILNFRKKNNVRTNSVNVRKFGHVTRGVFHVYYRWTDVIC